MLVVSTYNSCMFSRYSKCICCVSTSELCISLLGSEITAVTRERLKVIAVETFTRIW